MANEKQQIAANEVGVIRGTVQGKAKYCRIGIRRKPKQEEIKQSRFKCSEEDRNGVIVAMAVMKWFCETHDCDICPLYESNYEQGKGFPCAKLPMHWNCPDTNAPTVDAVEIVNTEICPICGANMDGGADNGI